MSLKRIITFCIVLFSTQFILAQTELNNYKYTVVPLQYDFLKGKDAYRLNTLTKYLFKEQGFVVFYSEQEQLPNDLNRNRCLGMYVDVIKPKGGFLKTKLQILIKDCNGNLIHSSEVGESREKEYKAAYHEALRRAFKSIETLQYSYNPKTSEVTATSIPEKVEVAVPEPPKVEAPPKPKVVETSKTPVKKPAESPKVITTSESIKATSSSIYGLVAKPTGNGFLLVDNDGNSVMTLLKTSSDTIFIVDGKSAVVYKNNDEWIYSENKGYTVIRAELVIKF